ncbi:alanine racemase [Streptomyces cellostaticus]|uniref:Pyridoxal phosphate homeostasis protein n=1 Tax=Streptomyces cellostaticus TaxID=67285 RepID=A0A117PVA3_9ACTN|nr:YggS family pyridoxal phosphate-dependent enzyme [Streptomyces cellostaticus]KUM93593.1 alanine racemase [Streptomyces cellostaticus]GHI10150.1 YggS family pyridoxal phosphate enzyme [Streptomyces cellostaticus]
MTTPLRPAPEVSREPDTRETRRAFLAERLAAVRSRIAHAAQAAGRDHTGITLITVTKTWPAEDVRLLAGLGVRDVGENQDQQASGKAAACADLSPALSWHFIGQLQTNKAPSVARYADMVHSVDRTSLVAALGKAARRTDRELRCLIQVSLDGAPGRGGAHPDTVPRLAALIADEPLLTVAGVMAVAPPQEPAERAFARLHRVREQLLGDHPGAGVMSAGMSGDLEAAIAAGATHIRVGSAILGRRTPAR